MEEQPTKSEIESVFHRLRSLPGNKTCFDCNAKNPTWSSVTYGVFICIDCSAVHRSLGVHLTFVRSTQLDTNWTWLQLRQMQLGGNSNALQFFSQHNCHTSDAQKKYNSRAAQLYREKLNQAAIASLQTDKELHVHAMQSDDKPQEKDVDFFSEEQDKFIVEDTSSAWTMTKKAAKLDLSEDGPKVDFTPAQEPRPSTITTRKPAAKKLGLGVKKGGLGATKVKTNFAEVEREAELAEESKLRAVEQSIKQAELSAKEQDDREAAVRLAYKDLSVQQQKTEEQVRRQDPRKAEQVERLGMGINSRSGISHSAISDMQEIEQENVQVTPSTLSSLGKLRISDEDNFFLDSSPLFNMNRITSGGSSNKIEVFISESLSSNNSAKDNWVILDDPTSKPSNSYKTSERSTLPSMVSPPSSSESAQKKFGNAKAISSDQFFNDNGADYETKANLNRFQGSSSISSADFFGNGTGNNQNSNTMPAYDLDDVKESVRQGVTKVAGKIGSLANDFMSSIQDRYGY